MKKLAFADSVKQLEMIEAGRAAMPRLPLLARLDGRAFHSLTRRFDRPFDTAMCAAMAETTKALVDEFHPCCGYTQSDEITLVWLEPTIFGGRFQKMTSVLAGYASARFHSLIQSMKQPTGAPRQIACFDCRVWQVPSLRDALDVLVWREDDATKNSLTMAAGAYYSHKQLMGKHSAEKQELLRAKGINWNDYPAHFKRGVYFKRVLSERKLTDAELAAIPEHARKSVENRLITRSRVEVLDMPPIRQYPVAAEVLLGRDLTDLEVVYEVVSAKPISYRPAASPLSEEKSESPES